jgi:hypothetical protein
MKVDRVLRCPRLHVAILIALSILTSCERLTGPESREIGGGYRLKRVHGSNGFALIIPNQSGGMIVDEIGWRNPLIIARGGGSQYWEVINTARAEHTRVNNETLTSNQEYRSIDVMPTTKAWDQLNPNTRVW